MGQRTCGFLVVRKPAQNFDAEGRGAFPSVAPCIGKTCYGGIDRMPWFDIEEAYYAKRLSEGPLRIWSTIRARNDDFTGLNVVEDFRKIPTLYCDFDFTELSRKNEVITVHSEELEALKGSIEIDLKVNWIGFDSVCLGESSLLRDGFFSVPGVFSEYESTVNNFGLFGKKENAERYVEAYMAAMGRDLVESVDTEHCTVSCIRVGVVSWAEIAISNQNNEFTSEFRLPK